MRFLWMAVAVFYALFAFAMAASPSGRAAPVLFVMHAITGGVALLAVSLQLALPKPPSRARLHRVLGRVYVVTACATSVASLVVVARFGVPALTKILFVAEALLWLSTTVVAFVQIRRGNVDRHREWMLRSFALAAFFVTFSLWDELLGTTPPAVLLSWSINLIVAELWIRKPAGAGSPRRRRQTAPTR